MSRASERRSTADGILEEVALNGRIQPDTLTELLALLAAKTDYQFHVEVAVVVKGLLKTVDNEGDAQETIARLKRAPEKGKKA